MRDAFIKALTDLAENDSRIILITGDLGFGVLTNFAKRFPKQFINAGVAEQNMTALACGLALEGYKPYTYSIANFPTLRCLEQIRNDICYHNADVTIVSVGAGFSYGQLGMSHFATEDLAIMRALPNMRVFIPSDPWEAAIMAKQMSQSPGPKYLRIDKGSAGLPSQQESNPLGHNRLIKEGKDITIISAGGITKEAIEAAEILDKKGISTRVLLVNCLKPLDSSLILEASTQTKAIITLEEHSIIGGLGSAVADICLSEGVPPKAFKKIGLNDLYPSVVGDQNYLRNTYGMSSIKVVDCILKLMSMKAP